MKDVIVDISVVVPVFNEQGNLDELYNRLTKVLGGVLSLNYEIVFVDDRSKDQSWSVIRRLAQEDRRVTGLRFSRNFGHHLALTAGLDYSAGQAVVIMDADLQDQPEEIEKLYAKYQTGYDVVYAIREERQFGFFKNVSSRVFLWLLNKLVDVDPPINTHIFRIMSRRVVDSLKSFRERERFITGLVSFVGFRQIGVPVEHGKRFSGKTKYTLHKMIRLAVVSITAFSYRPLRLASIFGFFFSFTGFMLIMILVYRRFAIGLGVEGWTSLAVIVIFMSGVQLLLLGLQGEYIGRIYGEIKGRPIYIMDENTGER